MSRAFQFSQVNAEFKKKDFNARWGEKSLKSGVRLCMSLLDVCRPSKGEVFFLRSGLGRISFDRRDASATESTDPRTQASLEVLLI